jgi:hypothetical protein
MAWIAIFNGFQMTNPNWTAAQQAIYMAQIAKELKKIRDKG